MNIYSMILVDDEPIILKGLVETFDWMGMGFQIVGSAKNGAEALELINELKPDVLVTDILMKKMDGLELISRCQESHPDLQFVVISAYREFEFAQRACSLGVYSYLLKPLDETQITETMRDLHSVITRRKAGKEQLYSYQKIFKDQQHAIETRNFMHYLVHNEEPRELEQGLRLVDSGAGDGDWFLASCLDISVSDRILEQIDISTQRFALSNVLLERIGSRYPCWCFELPDGRLVLILRRGLEQEDIDLPFLRSCLAYSESALKLHVTAAFSKPMQGFTALRQAYQQALRLFELGSETGINVIPFSQDAKEQPPGVWYPVNYENEIIHAIRLNDADLSEESFSGFMDTVEALGDIGLIQLCCHRLALSILFFLKETYGLTAQVEKILCSYLKNVQGLKPGDAREVLGQAIIRMISARCELSGKVLDTQADKYIAGAQGYIERHLGQENLSICDISNQLHLNAVYFGRLFKSRTGKTFKEYLQQKRIEKSMRLLDTTDRSVIEVAQEVGIQSPSYFSQLFKQQTGVLPSDYKRNTNI